jgi:mRNA interferase MazF
VQASVTEAPEGSERKADSKLAGESGCCGRLEMKRGDIVTVSLPGAYGKPRPALVIQSDLFDQHPSVTILPVTSELRDTPLFRILVHSTPENGLLKTSQVMVDKTHTVPRDKIRRVVGQLDETTMLSVNRAVALFLGFA